MWSGFLTSGGAASASWWGFDPLSNSVHSPGSGMELWIFGVMLATLGQLLWAGCILATALRGRAPGMTLMRMPVFTWSMVATCLLTLFAFPALIVALWLLWAQRHFGGVLTGGLGAIDYQQLFWFYGHPVVYVMFFPFVGMVGEILATFSSRRFFGHSAFVVALLAFAGLSMTVWAHHMFTIGQKHEQVLRADLDRAGGAGGDRVLRLHGDPVARTAALHHRLPVRARLPRAVPGGWADGRSSWPRRRWTTA